MIAERLTPGATIGLFCPSHVADRTKYVPIISALKRLGFGVKLGANFYKDGYGYAATAEERAADLNALAADGEVRMVLFSGGDSAAETLPYIDFDTIRRHPKLYSSYSDATPILNAIHAQTGLVTYYGASASMFDDLRQYNYAQFCAHFMAGQKAETFAPDSEWRTLRGGACAGTLIGGYSALFALMLGSPYFVYDTDRDYLLFLEDHERFSQVGTLATWLAFIGQHAFMRRVRGLVFGHYSENVPDDLPRCLERFGARHNIPVVYTDDFGHGTRHAIFPIGLDAGLDADKQTLAFLSERE